MKNKLYYQYAGSSALLILVFLGYVVRFYPSWLQGFDSVLTSVIRHPYPNWNSFYLWVTKFGNPSTMVILTAAFLLVLLMGKRYAEALWLTINVGLIGGLVNPLIKLVFLRQRPTLEHLVLETSYSFPSGHSNASMLLFGTLIFMTPLFIQHKQVRLVVQILLGCLILSIGVSRVYLGVHFPSDVLGGFCLGLSWLLLTYPIYEEKRFVWRFKSKQK
ncbi:phospholipid phosphatase [Enterococcus sp. JM4C]|uniref:phosphatase PAP2 family protein n=1 Tax=Candidatus Enterococcus huntleyi TaxID=1857217 RepID=UPI001379BAB1|nr:phosphatase PAP2 family protein [Enterococcus sp. JM4C]KAF1296688.1 phospholipid phosphatase [Enterococcus sp. JM4C]